MFENPLRNSFFGEKQRLPNIKKNATPFANNINPMHDTPLITPIK